MPSSDIVIAKLFKKLLSPAAQCQLTSFLPSQFFNFTSLYFCDLNQNIYLTILMFIIFTVLLLKYINKLYMDYTTPAILTITNHYSISQTPLCNVSLLALSYSIIYIITALAASNVNKGISYNIGSLLGSSVFFMGFIIPVLLLASKNKNKEINFMV